MQFSTLPSKDTDLLVTVSKNISGALGEEFLSKIVVEMSKVLGADFLFIGRVDEEADEVETLAMSIDGKKADNITYELADTPCENVTKATSCCHTSDVAAIYPKDTMLADLGIEGYLGTPLFYSDGSLLGLIVALYKKSIDNQDVIETLFDVYSSRISAEIERLDKEAELKELNETLEEKVEQRTRTLRSMNEEMETFIDIVAHGLRTPLRSIKGFSSNIDTDHADILPDDAKHQLQRVISNSISMENQLTALLELSEITRKEYIFTTINISKLAHAAFDEIASNEDKVSFKLDIEENLKTIADRSAAYSLLKNIISNAIKYSRHCNEPTIKIGADKNGWLFVEDNGKGFSQEHADKMFHPFQRIHASRELAGTGIGLATCQRIINKHGGQIEAKGIPDEGARISFTFIPGHGE